MIGTSHIPNRLIPWIVTITTVSTGMVFTGCRPDDNTRNSQWEARLDVLRHYADQVLESRHPY